MLLDLHIYMYVGYFHPFSDPSKKLTVLQLILIVETLLLQFVLWRVIEFLILLQRKSSW